MKRREPTTELENLLLGLLAIMDLTPSQTDVAQEYLQAMGIHITPLEDGVYARQAKSTLTIVENEPAS